MKFSRDATESALATRGVIAGKDARNLAAEILSMDNDPFREAFTKSPIKRAKRIGLQRNAAVVLASVGNADSIER